MSHNSCDSYNLMTWAHKIQTTCKDNAILHRSFRHTEILVLSWRNIISPRSFWFHQESTHFTKSPSISPRLNLFHQDIFDFAKIFSISPRVHPFHQVRISPRFSPRWVDPLFLTVNTQDFKTNPLFPWCRDIQGHKPDRWHSKQDHNRNHRKDNHFDSDPCMGNP